MFHRFNYVRNSPVCALYTATFISLLVSCPANAVDPPGIHKSKQRHRSLKVPAARSVAFVSIMPLWSHLVWCTGAPCCGEWWWYSGVCQLRRRLGPLMSVSWGRGAGSVHAWMVTMCLAIVHRTSRATVWILWHLSSIPFICWMTWYLARKKGKRLVEFFVTGLSWVLWTVNFTSPAVFKRCLKKVVFNMRSRS